MNFRIFISSSSSPEFLHVCLPPYASVSSIPGRVELILSQLPDRLTHPPILLRLFMNLALE